MEETKITDVFVTETDEAAYRKEFLKTIGITFLVMTLLASLAFFIGWKAFVFFELIVVISSLITIFTRKSQRFELRFEGNRLRVTDLRKSITTEVSDKSQGDFLIGQTGKQIEPDYCSLMIKGTLFQFGDVKKCRELKAYIESHFAP